MLRSLPMERTTTSPELRPIRMLIATPVRALTRAAWLLTASCIRSAAWQARTAWSSWAMGAPNRAMMPSPMTWFTVPS
jgi:hypothetical protein